MVAAIAKRGHFVWVWTIIFVSFLEVESFGRPFLRSSTSRATSLRYRRTNRSGHADANEGGPSEFDEPPKKNEIVVSSDINLPFPAELAYAAFSDMSRQTSWSPWLQSVEYTDDTHNTTLW